MKATLNPQRKDFNVNYRKENQFYRTIMALMIDGDTLLSPIEARFYATQSRCYCCVWLCGKDHYTNGSAFASGYGYHRASAALGEALHNAGVDLSDDIDGRGDTAMEEALKAVASALYPDAKIFIRWAHA